MTREEAINKLNWALDNNTIEDVQSAYEYIMAIRMAIKALEQEPFINKPCVSEKQCEHDKNVVLDKVRAEIQELPIQFTCAHEMQKWALEIIDKYRAESEG